MSKNHLTALKPDKNSIILRKRTAKLTRKSVLKMLAVMEASQSTDSNKSAESVSAATSETRAEDFLQSGRTGRRNALADILSEHAAVSSSDLPARLQSLTTNEKPDEKSESSKCGSSKS